MDYDLTKDIFCQISTNHILIIDKTYLKVLSIFSYPKNVVGLLLSLNGEF